MSCGLVTLSRASFSASPVPGVAVNTTTLRSLPCTEVGDEGGLMPLGGRVLHAAWGSGEVLPDEVSVASLRAGIQGSDGPTAIWVGTTGPLTRRGGPAHADHGNVVPRSGRAAARFRP